MFYQLVAALCREEDVQAMQEQARKYQQSAGLQTLHLHYANKYARCAASEPDVSTNVHAMFMLDV